MTAWLEGVGSASGPRALPLSVPRCRTRGPAAGPTGARLPGPDFDPRGVLWGEHKPGRFMWTFGPSALEAAGHLARGQIPGTPRGRRVSAACSGAQVSAGSARPVLLPRGGQASLPHTVELVPRSVWVCGLRSRERFIRRV